MKRTNLLLMLMLSSLLPAAASTKALLPQPQKIQTGQGHLSVDSLSIRFAASPAAEDRFAAQQLSVALSARLGKPVPVVQATAGGKSILLNRTGAVDPLPVGGDRPGPDSREAYYLKVTPEDAEIRGRSSAGLFYGVQTLRQLLEGEGGAAVLPEVTVEDWPSLAYRGTMVDMSHGPLPTEEEVKRQMDFLARWKGNQYYFYTEASIELERYPLLNPEG
jgi:hexosaminidase